MIETVRKFRVLFLLVFSVAVVLYCQWPVLSDPFSINDDARNVVLRASLWEKPGLFDYDLYVRYASFYVPYPLELLYRAFSPYIPATTMTKIIPFIITAACVLLMSRVCRTIGGEAGGFIGPLLLLFFFWSGEGWTFGASDRGDFHPLLILLFLLALNSGRQLWVAVIFIIQTAFYMPSFIICALTWSLSFVSNLFQSREINRKKMAESLPAVAAVVGCIVFSAFKLWVFPDSAVGEPFSMKETLSMEEFHENGRIPLYFESILESLTNKRSGLVVNAGLIFILASLSIFALLSRGRGFKIGKDLWSFFAASVILFTVSKTILFLYHPSRYVQVSIPMVLIFIICRSFAEPDDWIVLRKKRGVVLITFIAGASLFYSKLLFSSYITVSERPLVEFIGSLPETSLIAGPPDLMDNISTFAGKRVYVSDEMSVPFFKGYYSIVKKRLNRFFEAYYSQSADSLDSLCKESGITHIIARKSDFSVDAPQSGRYFYEPFDSKIRNYLNEGRKAFLASPPAEAMIYEDSGHIVVSCYDPRSTN